ncbi:hypothetical protein pipiens_007677, partial [Culex pipiens pipiens]
MLVQHGPTYPDKYHVAMSVTLARLRHVSRRHNYKSTHLSAPKGHTDDALALSRFNSPSHYISARHPNRSTKPCPRHHAPLHIVPTILGTSSSVPYPNSIMSSAEPQSKKSKMVSSLEQLKQLTTIVADTGDFE